MPNGFLGRVKAALLCAALFHVSGLGATTLTFSTPGSSTWTIPPGVSSIQVAVTGAGGGGGSTGGPGGNGGKVTATVAVTSGDNWTWVVGSGGSANTTANLGGGGGGGSSAFLSPAQVTPARMLIAGGGGGGGDAYNGSAGRGGDGGGAGSSTGADGLTGDASATPGDHRTFASGYAGGNGTPGIVIGGPQVGANGGIGHGSGGQGGGRVEGGNGTGGGGGGGGGGFPAGRGGPGFNNWNYGGGGGGGGSGGSSHADASMTGVSFAVAGNGGAAGSPGGNGSIEVTYTVMDINGVCGTPAGPVTSIPSTGLCATGLSSSITSTASRFRWACAGAGNGSSTAADACSVERGYTANLAVGAHGTVSPAGPLTVAYNTPAQLTISPAPGYAIDAVGGTCGGSLNGNVFTSNAVMADCNISVTFKLVTSGYTQAYTSPGNYTWTIPPGVSSVMAAVSGAGGGAGANASGGRGGAGGAGDTMMVNLPAVPGEVWNLVVGAGGSLHAGGAASSIFKNGTALVIAGAGGGGGGAALSVAGGAGGGGHGGTGGNGVGTGGAGGNSGIGGTGGLGVAGGSAGLNGSSTTSVAIVSGGSGGQVMGLGGLGGSGGSGYGGGGGGGGGGNYSYMGIPMSGGGGGGGASYASPDVTVLSYSSANNGSPGADINAGTGDAGQILLLTSGGSLVNGVCAAGAGLQTAPPATGLCSAGTATAVSATTSQYSWGCNGSGGGTSTASNACTVGRGYVVTPSFNANGTVSPSTPQVVAYNTAVQFNVTPQAGNTASVGGSCDGTLSGTLYTTSPITHACLVSISFAHRQAPVVMTSTQTGTVNAVLLNGSGGCAFDSAQSGSISPAAAYHGSMNFPHGGYRWRLTGCDVGGETVRVTVSFPSLSGMTLMKYGPTPTSGGNSVWYAPNNLLISGNTATYDVSDGQMGDDDLTVNGTIVDPVFAVPIASATGVPTLNGLMIWLLGLGTAGLGLGGLRRRSARQASLA